jgi:hypothetical protein
MKQSRDKNTLADSPTVLTVSNIVYKDSGKVKLKLAAAVKKPYNFDNLKYMIQKFILDFESIDQPILIFGKLMSLKSSPEGLITGNIIIVK